MLSEPHLQRTLSRRHQISDRFDPLHGVGMQFRDEVIARREWCSAMQDEECPGAIGFSFH